jgi:hypothetical protein
MAHNRFVWSGLAELRAALRTLPADLARGAAPVVTDAAEGAAAEVRSNYQAHAFTGNLAKSVQVKTMPGGGVGARAEVRASASHAHWFEYGTAGRQTSQGAYRGVMPAAPPVHAFIPTVMAARRRMYRELGAVLERAGLEVSGNAD